MLKFRRSYRFNRHRFNPPMPDNLDPNGPPQRVRFENQQISSRMGWYATAQSFLLIAYVNVLAHADIQTAFPRWIIPCIGSGASILVFCGVGAAMRRLEQTSGYERDGIVWFGLLYPLLMPPIFLGMWVYLWFFVHPEITSKSVFFLL